VAAQDYTTATDLADYLVRQGVPFRDAHRVVGELVAACVARGQQLPEVTLTQLREHSDRFEADALAVLGASASAAARDVPGGTAPRRVREAMAAARQRLATSRERLAELRAVTSHVEELLA
jgi:argininosuccinate lyase